LTLSIAGIAIPDSRLAREVSELIRDTESAILYHHSVRVYLFGALAGVRKRMKFDPELLYIGAMFHDMGLTPVYRSSVERFEIDSANAARDFMRRHRIPDSSIEIVWDSIALHTTPGIPQHKKPEVALVTAGVEMDVMGVAYAEFTDDQRNQVLAVHPRGSHFKQNIIQAFADGMENRPSTTFGTVNADVLDRMDPHYVRANFCDVILGSSWLD